MSKRTEEIRARLEATSPRPWGYNSYSMVASTPLVHKEDERVDNGDLDTPYEEDPVVCHVPAKYGDTARPPHSNNAEFIAHAPEDIEYLLDRVEELELILADQKYEDLERAVREEE